MGNKIYDLATVESVDYELDRLSAERKEKVISIYQYFVLRDYLRKHKRMLINEEYRLTKNR